MLDRARNFFNKAILLGDKISHLGESFYNSEYGYKFFDLTRLLYSPYYSPKQDRSLEILLKPKKRNLKIAIILKTGQNCPMI